MDSSAVDLRKIARIVDAERNTNHRKERNLATQSKIDRDADALHDVGKARGEKEKENDLKHQWRSSDDPNERTGNCADDLDLRFRTKGNQKSKR